MDGRLVRAGAIGVVAGVMSGLLGVGGGIVMVPLLVPLSALSQHESHATSLAAIAPIAAVGAARFTAAGAVDGRVAILLAAGSLVGAPLGATLLHRASEATLRLVFGGVMVAVGIGLLLP